MSSLWLFLPCAADCENFLADEVHGITGRAGQELLTGRGGVRVRGDWPTVMRLNLESRIAQRVLVELAHAPCRDERDLYELAMGVAWEAWFDTGQSFRVDLTAHASPLKSLNYAALRVKDGVADRFRQQAGGVRPNVDTRHPDARVHVHLDTTHVTLYIDTSGEPLFKRGWRQAKGDAPLKETLGATMLAACGWWQPTTRQVSPLPLYDPCCGSGTIIIEAAQLALGLPAGGQRHFGFERLKPFDASAWQAMRRQFASRRPQAAAVRIYGSDVSQRMADFARRNAQRAGVAAAVQIRGGDALERLPPSDTPGVMLLNPPYGERIDVAGTAGREKFRLQEESATTAAGDATASEFFRRLAAHWKTHYAGWTSWVLSPDTSLPSLLRLKATRRVPLWNGPIECRLMRFDLTARQAPADPASSDLRPARPGDAETG